MQPAWHIGLAPLLDTAFNRSKSPIKAMDYAAIGLATLASDMPSIAARSPTGRPDSLWRTITPRGTPRWTG